ncbi:hypothetical protein MMC25_002026 [Agyrium rufum]|nr:hypothetical protein [Agyrium rufum]
MHRSVRIPRCPHSLSASTSPRLIPSLRTRRLFSQTHRSNATATDTSGPPRNGPYMERIANRPLPNLVKPRTLWLKTLPVFAVIMVISSLALFNYQKSTSSVVNATLYALRTNPKARDLLGDEIYFRDRFPWIWGELNQMHGKIDLEFGVKGKKAGGMMRFRSVRRQRPGYFETQEWSLTMEDGTVYQLLETATSDPFKNTALEANSS